MTSRQKTCRQQQGYSLPRTPPLPQPPHDRGSQDGCSRRTHCHRQQARLLQHSEGTHKRRPFPPFHHPQPRRLRSHSQRHVHPTWQPRPPPHNRDRYRRLACRPLSPQRHNARTCSRHEPSRLPPHTAGSRSHLPWCRWAPPPRRSGGTHNHTCQLSQLLTRSGGRHIYSPDHPPLPLPRSGGTHSYLPYRPPQQPLRSGRSQAQHPLREPLPRWPLWRRSSYPFLLVTARPMMRVPTAAGACVVPCCTRTRRQRPAAVEKRHQPRRERRPLAPHKWQKRHHPRQARPTQRPWQMSQPPGRSTAPPHPSPGVRRAGGEPW